jgi:2'-5' RNA ligase
MEKIRTFLALPVPAEFRKVMADVQSELIQASAEVKWESSDKFHITLKFLGDTNPSVISSLHESLVKSIGSFPSFDIIYAGLGSFPTIDRPRIVWIGTQPCEEVQRLYQCVEESSSSLGFAKDDRPFHAHVTLGRVKGNRGLDRLTAKLKSVTFQALTARCTEIHIMRSVLKPTGSVYTLLNSIPLAP